MLKLKFNLRHQDIQLVNKGVVVATDSKDYLVAKFNTVSADWEAPLTAIFTDDKHNQPYAVIVGTDERLAEDECFVPWEVLTDAANVYVSVYCGNLHTTVTAAFKVRKSGYIDGETPPPPSPTVYDIIMQAITDLQVGKQDKLTAGENITIDENDGTISAEGGVTSYVDLDNKPQINGHELVGNKTGDDLGLQNKLTAGENITINANGEISATGGTDDYEELTNKPQINGVELIGYKTSRDLGLNNYVDLIGKPIINGTVVSGNEAAITYGLASAHYLNNREIEEGFINTYKVDNTTMYVGYINFTNLPEGSALTERGQVWSYSVYEWEGYARDEYVQYGFSTKGKLYCRTGEQRMRPGQGAQPIEWNDWIEFNRSISSATVNQNGTITFTMSDGSTVTTTGESVIGPQGPAGADGNDYVLTAQDKTDIANIVLSELPTTQGVQYGNASN